MNYYCLRVSFEENMRIANEELRRKDITGFGCREFSEKHKLHNHYVLFTDSATIQQLRAAFNRRGITGNENYSCSVAKDVELSWNYACKEYTPETLEYCYGIEYTHEWLQARRDIMDASFDPKKAGGKKRPRAEVMMEEICHDLDSSSPMSRICYNVLLYCRNHFDETKFWTRERKEAMVYNVELQLKGHREDYIEAEIQRMGFNK